MFKKICRAIIKVKDKDMEKGMLTLVGMENGASALENSFTVPLNFKS